MGHELPLGWMGIFVTKLAVYRKDRQVENAARRMGFMFGTRSMEENSRFIRFAAEYLAYRYEMQLNRLKQEGEGVQFVAECAAERAIQYITSSDSNLASQELSLVDRAWHAMSQFVNYQKYAPMLVADYKGPISLIIDGVIEGISEKDIAKSVGTIAGESWVPGGIFRNVGFMLEGEKGQFYLFRHPKLLTTNQSAEAKDQDTRQGLLMYGYSRIRPEELELIKKQGYVEDYTPMEEVFKRFPRLGDQVVSHQLQASNPLLLTNRM